MKKIVKYGILLTVGGSIYCGIELLFRGYTHWSMWFVGGLCLICVGLINNIIPWKMPLILQMAIGGVIITAIEFISGVVLNILCGLDVWSYADFPGNILGQVCPQFFAIWCLISAPAIVLDDYLRYWLFGEDSPVYYTLLRWKHE